MEKMFETSLYVFSNFPHCNILWIFFFLDFLSSTIAATIEYWWTTIYTRCEMFEQETKQQEKTKSERKRWTCIRLNYFFTVVSCLHPAKMHFFDFFSISIRFYPSMNISIFSGYFNIILLFCFRCHYICFFFFIWRCEQCEWTSATKYKKTIFVRYVCKKIIKFHLNITQRDEKSKQRKRKYV